MRVAARILEQHPELTEQQLHFCASFLRLLRDGGINEYEDQDAPFPRGQVATAAMRTG